ncbi:hypothetical protein Tco_0355756 [Tanacetum coccineum]
MWLMISRIYKVFGVVFMKKRRLWLKEHDEVVEGFHTSNDVQKGLKMLYRIVHGFGSRIEQDASFKEKLTD